MSKESMAKKTDEGEVESNKERAPWKWKRAKGMQDEDRNGKKARLQMGEGR